jgi:hypothetical protein
VQHLLFLPCYRCFHPSPSRTAAQPYCTSPARLRIGSPSDQDPPGAICTTRGGEAPDCSRTWTPSYFSRTTETRLYISATASQPYSAASG